MGFACQPEELCHGEMFSRVLELHPEKDSSSPALFP